MASIQIIERTRSRTARVAAGSAGAAFFRGAGTDGLGRSLALNGEAGELLVQSLALTFGTLRPLRSQDYRFKVVVAFAASVFKNRHTKISSVRILTVRGIMKLS
jgi:hypothetical protein